MDSVRQSLMSILIYIEMRQTKLTLNCTAWKIFGDKYVKLKNLFSGAEETKFHYFLRNQHKTANFWEC